jgi:glutamate/tyrosine decarboxylase-like PLP-dependent enzyme
MDADGLAAEAAARYLAELPERRVAPARDAVARLAELGGPLPEGPSDAAVVVRLLDDIAGPATVASAGGRYFGFVTGSTLPAARAAIRLVAAWDQNACMTVMSPAAAELERVAATWLLDVLTLPPTSAVGFVTGATMGNLTGLAAARHAVLTRHGWDVEDDGLVGAPPVRVVVGEEVHVSLLKALSLLGLGRRRIERVPVDEQGRLRPAELPALDDATILCLQAGNVNTGASDPFGELVDRAHDAGAWVHVDGAFGLWLAAAPARAHLVAGIGAADSWSTDGHKWLNVGYDCGLAICRDPAPLVAAMSATAAYLPSGERPDAFQYAPEMSRRARGVEVWAALRSLGRSGVADLVERTCRLATRFADGLRAAGHDVLNDVVANQVLVSFGSDDETRRTVAAVQADGTCWCGSTIWQGRAAMRISVSSWATTEADVDRSLEAMVRLAPPR